MKTYFFVIALLGYSSGYAFNLNSPSIVPLARFQNGKAVETPLPSSALWMGQTNGNDGYGFLKTNNKDDMNADMIISKNNDNNMILWKNGCAMKKTVSSMAVAMALTISILGSGNMVANAYDDNYDDASDTIATVISNLKSASKAGDGAAALTEFENIAAIITEGKGVGGSISNYGVKLDRGFVADEDTAIYNPGLSLLTESEKGTIIDSLIDTRKTLSASGKWSSDDQVGYSFLKEKLDPLHMTELKGYLGILPFYGAVIYMASFAVQQFAREGFPAAYAASVLALFLPIVALIVFGA